MTASCEHCGSRLGEISYSVTKGAHLCLCCHRHKDGPAKAPAPSSSLPSSRSLVPSSSFLVSSGAEESEVEHLLRSYEEGGIQPVKVLLRPLPDELSPAAHQVAELFELVVGLRLWAGDERPVVFACGWIASKLNIPKATAWRARTALAEAGVIAQAGVLPARGKRGTFTYEAVPVDAADVVPIRAHKGAA